MKGVVVRVTTQGGPFPDASPAVVRRRAEKMLLPTWASPPSSSPSPSSTTPPTTSSTAPGATRTSPRTCSPFRSRSSGRAPPRRPVSSWATSILSVETARCQAARHRRPLLAELTMLLAHGLLHLLGYDHETEAEERKMTAQTRVLETAAAARRAAAP